LVEIDPAVASQNLLRACREDDYETAMEYLEGKEIKVDYEDSEKWTPLSWSSCNGNEKLVKIMLREHNAAAMYMQVKVEEDEVDSNHDPFVKPKVASEVGRYTPLHWASYKSHYRIVWILLKEGLSPLDIDVFGNTAVHQAAAAGSIQVLQWYLSRGVDMELKNARGHTAFDLATNKAVKDIISKARATEKWGSWFSVFDFKNIRYYCVSCGEFYCSDCSKTLWEFDSPEAEYQEKPVCRCNSCDEKKKKSEKAMREANETMDFETVHKVISELKTENLDLDVKLMKAAEILHLKLELEKGVNEYIESLLHVTNYKTIKKSVSTLEDKIQHAKDLNVDIDQEILNKVNSNIARLIAERNLQFQMEKVKVSDSSHDDVKVLEDLIHKSKATNVASEYTDRADIYLDKMKRNIKAREILDLLEQYPPREYPEIEIVDPKNKNKKVDPPKKPKKKKKQPPFPTPEWALSLDTLKEEFKNLDTLMKDQDGLELTPDFIARYTVSFERFKKQEIPFRDEEIRLEEEKEALKKAKKANKAKGK
jgi:hypothetical protein